MKKIIFTIAIILVLASCKQADATGPVQQTVIPGKTSLEDEYLLDHLEFGLHKIVVDDSTTVLIYRGNGSCTMIQIK